MPIKLKHSTVLLIPTIILFALLLIPSTAKAYSAYRTIPTSLRGYYISKSARRGVVMSSHKLIIAIPRADSTAFTVDRVYRSGHHYSIHSHVYFPNRINRKWQISHYARNKIRFGNKHYTKVRKLTYYYFINH